MHRRASMVGQTPRGSVIVLVLALVALAGFLLTQFVERSMTEMLVESRARQADRLRVDAHSALEASLAVLANYQVVDGGLYAPGQGWGEPLPEVDFSPRPGTTVTARIEDESGRISLPRLGPADLTELGKRLGLKEAEAEKLTDALLGWTRRDHAATHYETDPRRYEYEDPPHRPPGRSLASFDELASIAVARDLFFTPEGGRTPLLEQFAASVSLYDFPAINLNTARREALELAGMDLAQAERIVAYHAGEDSRAPGAPPYFRSVAEAQALLGPALPMGRFDTQARCLRVGVTVREGAAAFHLTAVVMPATDASGGAGEPTGPTPVQKVDDLQYPFRLLAWEESIELASTTTP